MGKLLTGLDFALGESSDDLVPFERAEARARPLDREHVSGELGAGGDEPRRHDAASGELSDLALLGGDRDHAVAERRVCRSGTLDISRKIRRLKREEMVRASTAPIEREVFFKDDGAGGNCERAGLDFHGVIAETDGRLITIGQCADARKVGVLQCSWISGDAVEQGERIVRIVPANASDGRINFVQFGCAGRNDQRKPASCGRVEQWQIYDVGLGDLERGNAQLDQRSQLAESERRCEECDADLIRVDL